jgi:hypothetical protein
MRNETARTLPKPEVRYAEENEREFRRELETQLREMLLRLPTPLVATDTWNPASIANDAVGTTTVTVRGAKVGDPASVGFSSLTTENALLTGKVSAANTVEVVLLNKTGAAMDLASGTLTVVVWKV